MPKALASLSTMTIVALYILSLVSLVVLAVTAQAIPIASWPFPPDQAHVILATNVIHPTMTRKEMMRMHEKMMGSGKKMSCKELMRMHQKMMGGKA
jgi:hypothetical protein